MKKWSLLFTIMIMVLSASAKIAPWNEPFVKKNYITKAPMSELVYISVHFCYTCGTPYGRVDITLKRAFAYNMCESTTVQVRLWKRVLVPGGTKGNPNYQWMWLWNSCGVRFPAYDDEGNFSFELKEGEAVEYDPGSYQLTNYQISNLQPC